MIKFWCDIGVDGFRLDAVPTWSNAKEPIAKTCRKLTNYSRDSANGWTGNYPDKMLLAEANQWPADVCAYFGKGDEFHMAFHFPLMPRMFMAVKIGRP